MLNPFDISIAVLEPKYCPGDFLEAVVTVDTDNDVRTEISVWLEARLVGHGTEHIEKCDAKVIVDDEIAAGSHSFPAALSVPNGPFSYSGKVVDLRWFVCARAAVSLARDPTAECAFELEFRPSDMPLAHIPPSDVTGPDVAGGAAGSEAAVAGLLGSDAPDSALAVTTFQATSNSTDAVIGSLGAITLVGGASVAIAAWPGGALPIVAIAVFFMSFLLIRFGPPMRRAMAEFRLGPVELELSPAFPSPGDKLRLTCSFTPRSNVVIGAMHADFVGKEVTVKGSGKHRKVYVGSVFQDWIPLEDNIVIEAGERRTFVASCTLPEDAPYSFTFPKNKLEWIVTLHMDLPKWPDWAVELSFNVVPRKRLLESVESNPVASDSMPYDAEPW